MRRTLLALAMLLGGLVFVPHARAVDQFEAYNGSCQQGGQPVTVNGIESRQDVQISYPSATCTVTVNTHGTTTPATLYSDAAGLQPLANPFIPTSNGQVLFYAANGRYDITYSGASILIPFTVSDITLCFNCSGGGGGSGTVTSVAASSLPPLFTTNVTNPTTTPAIAFSISQAAAYQVLANCTGALADPAYCSINTNMLPFTYSGNTTKLATVTGSPTAGVCTEWDANGNIVNAASGLPCSSGGGSGSPGTPLSSLQWNNASSFAGAQQTTVTAGTGINPAEVDIANFNVIKYNSGFNFDVTPSGTLSAGSNTVTLPGSCPAGLTGADTAASAKWHYIYVQGAGGDTNPSEPVLITGGSCTSGAASGTIQFSAAFSHIAGYHLTSATAGIQETLSLAGSPASYVIVPPSAAHTGLTLKAPIYTTIQRLVFEGNGTFLACQFNDSCIIMGNRSAFANKGNSSAATYTQQVIRGFNMYNDREMWSVQPTGGVTGGATTETLNISACPADFYPLIPNQVLWLSGSVAGSPTAPYGIGEYVTSIGGTCLPGGAGTIIVQEATPGITNISAHDSTSTLSNGVGAMLEDNAQDSAFYDISFISNTATKLTGHGIQIDNDQSANAHNIHATSSNTFRHDADFVGSAFYSPGPFSINAGLLFVDHMEVAGPAACVDWWNGNDITINGGVCQAYRSFGMRFRGGSGRKNIEGVHFEIGSVTNPLGVIGIPNIINTDGSSSTLSIIGAMSLPEGASTLGQTSYPNFLSVAAQSATQYYYASFNNNLLSGCTSGGNCISIPVPFGVAVVNDPSANNVTVKLPVPPGVTSVDILRVASASATVFSGTPIAPNGTGNYKVGTMTVNATNCDIHGICSFVDNVATGSLSSYTVALTGGKLLYPNLYDWPGSVVLGNSATGTAPAPLGNYTGQSTCVVSVNAPGFASNNVPAGVMFTNPTGASGGVSCMPQPQTIYVPYYGGAFSGSGTSGTTLMPATSGIANLKGRLNLGPQNSSIYDLVTLSDSNWAKTISTPFSITTTGFFRPTKDANDCYLGFDGAGGLSSGCQTSVSQTIGVIQDGSNWTERLTSAVKNFKVPVTSTGLGTFVGLASSLPLDVSAGTYTFSGPEVSAPTAPAAGKQRCYQVAGSGLACKDSANNVYTMTPPGAGTNYQTMQNAGAALPVEPIFNCTGAGVTCSDDPGNTRTNINVTGGGTVTTFSAGTLSPLFTTSVANATTTPALTFALTSAGGGTVFGRNGTGTGAPAYTIAPVLGIPGTSTGTLGFGGATSGTAIITPQAASGSPTLTLPTTTGTFAVSATSPLVLNSTTGVLTAPSVVTSAGMTINRIPVATGAQALVDSCLTSDGTTVANQCSGGLIAGTGNPSIQTNTASNTDLAGKLTLSAGTATYNFLGTWGTAPICAASDTSAVAAVRVQTSTTVLTLTGTGTDVINYICVMLN